jgi:hypothetical protein
LASSFQGSFLLLVGLANPCSPIKESKAWVLSTEPLFCLLRCLQINDALKDLMPEIHALSIKRCWTKAQQAANTQQAAAAGTTS